MKLVALGLLAAAAMLQTPPAPAGLHVWKTSDVRKRGEDLAKKLDAQKVASEVVATEGNRRFVIAHRQGSGAAEIHDREADIMIITAGEITIQYGGTIVDGKTTEPGEIRGSAIRGGTEVALTTGDVLHIPARVPHQMKLAPGKQVTYLVAKVVEK